MTNTIDTYVCIGGPADGQRWATQTGLDCIQVWDSETNRVVFYRSTMIGGERQVFSFWLCDGTSINEALASLFANYVPPAPRHLP